MRKKLIAAIIVVLLLIAAAVGVIVYMESGPGDATEPEVTEETVGISLPTEDPDEVTPEDSFGENDVVPPATDGIEYTGETENPDSNETPEDIF